MNMNETTNSLSEAAKSYDRSWAGHELIMLPEHVAIDERDHAIALSTADRDLTSKDFDLCYYDIAPIFKAYLFSMAWVLREHEEQRDWIEIWSEVDRDRDLDRAIKLMGNYMVYRLERFLYDGRLVKVPLGKLFNVPDELMMLFFPGSCFCDDCRAGCPPV